MRVAHITAGDDAQAWTLSRAERALDVRSDVLAEARGGGASRGDIVYGRPEGLTERQINERVRVGLQAPRDYDVLHYHGDSLFCWDGMEGGGPHRFLDLRLAKALGRRVVFTLADAPEAGFAETALPLFAERVFYLDPQIGRAVPDGTFLPRCQAVLQDGPRAEGPLRIVQVAQDDSQAAEMTAAAEGLNAQTPLALTILRDTAPGAAEAAVDQADLVVDQQRRGWYGPLGLRALALGKAVVCHLAPSSLPFTPPGMADGAPAFDLRHGHLAEDLAAALAARDSWTARGEQARRHVARWHDPARIASAMLRVYGDPSAALDVTAG